MNEVIISTVRIENRRKHLLLKSRVFLKTDSPEQKREVPDSGTDILPPPPLAPPNPPVTPHLPSDKSHLTMML